MEYNLYIYVYHTVIYDWKWEQISAMDHVHSLRESQQDNFTLTKQLQ